MGMGSAPASAWTISNENLRKIVPQEYDHLLSILESNDLNLDNIALSMQCDSKFSEDKNVDKALGYALDNLSTAFRDKTSMVNANSHLEITLNYYNSEDGDRYDELEDGAFWTVEGVEMLTPSGNKFREFLEFSRWTIYG